MAEHQGFAIKGCSFFYGETPVLREIDLDLAPGKFYGLVGPNGCGKTTFLDLLTGNRRPQQGTVTFRDREVTAYRRRELARSIALVPQEYAIDFAFTVEEVILMGRHPYLPRFGSPAPADLALVAEAMAEIGISRLEGRFVNGLSGGEKQRVAVARALVQQTPVLLLDEATSSLDIRYTLQILAALRKKVRTEGKTVIAVMHDLNLAAAFCDEILFLHEGRLRQAGSTREVLNPETIRQTFGVESSISYNEFSRSLQVSFRLEES